MEPSEIDTDLRTNLCMMNELFDSIIKSSQITIENIPDVDLTTSQDFSLMGEVLLSKLSLIEKFCDTAASSTQKKYDARTIKDKIALKRKQLAELEAENAALVETARRQEKALRQINQTDEEAIEAQQNVLKLKNQLQAAQKEIKILEEKRHGLLSENRKLKGQVQSTQKTIEKGESGMNFNSDELNSTISNLEDRQKQLEARKEREQIAYQKKMKLLKDQKDELLIKKKELEQKLKEKQKELELIHDKSKKLPVHYPLSYRK